MREIKKLKDERYTQKTKYILCSAEHELNEDTGLFDYVCKSFSIKLIVNKPIDNEKLNMILSHLQKESPKHIQNRFTIM